MKLSTPQLMTEKTKYGRYTGYVVGIILYRIMVDICYFGIMTREYAHYGYLNNFSFAGLLLSYIVLTAYLLILTNILTNCRSSVSGIIIFCWTLMSFVPFTSLISAGILSAKFIFFNCIYTAILIMTATISTLSPPKEIKIEFLSKINIDWIVNIVGIVCVAVVVLISYVYTGFRINFNLSQIYTLRDEFASYSMPTVVQYMFSWSRALNNILIAYCITKKKKLMAVMLFVAQILSFGIDGSKVSFFMTLVVIVVCLFFKKVPFDLTKKLAVWGFFAIALLCFAEYDIRGSFMLAGLFIQRILYMPTYIGNCYIDFFTTHTPDFFRSSFLRFFGVKSPYEDIRYMIGMEYYHDTDMGANNGLISDAITNMSYIGIVVMPIIVVLVMRLLDSCTKSLDKRIKLSVGIYFSLIMMNNFLIPSLITHGLVVSIILLIIINQNERLHQNLL